MYYVLLNIYLLLYFIRPTEWVSGIIGSPLLLVVGVISLLLILLALFSQVGATIFAGPEEKIMLGFLCAICLSHLSHGYYSGLATALTKFVPTLTGFYLVLIAIRDKRHFQYLVFMLLAVTSFLGYEGIRQFTTGYAHGGMEPLYQQVHSGDGELGQIRRIRWYGVFNDPNDLGLAFVMTIPFIVNMLHNKKFIVPLLSMSFIAPALYFTNSRGSILASLVSIACYYVFRYRSTKGVVVGGVLAALLFTLGPSRMGGMSASDDSAHGRVEAWYAAYQMLKDNPLFGVGQGMFTDFHTLTAHNSFILVMAELGACGLFFFTGLIYYSYNRLWKTLFQWQVSLTDQDNGLVSSAFASLSGVLTAIFFISRSYVLIPYMAIAMAISISRIIEKQYRLNENSPAPVATYDYKRIAYFTLGQIIMLNVLVKVII